MHTSKQHIQWLVFIYVGAVFLMSGCGRPETLGSTAAVGITPSNVSQPAYPLPKPTEILPTPVTVIPATPTPLINASPQEVAKLAIAYTERAFPNQNPTTDVALARLVTNEDLTAMGLPSGYYLECANPPPMMLVIVKGNFDIIGLYGPGAPPAEHPRANYILYIYNLQIGEPTTIVSSQYGGKFKKALNDPSLPDDPTAIPETNVPTAVASNLPSPLPTPSSKHMCQFNVPAPGIGSVATPSP